MVGPNLYGSSRAKARLLDEIWEMVEQAYFDGRITWRQRGLFRWAAQKAQAVESPVQSLDGVEEL